MRPILMAYFGLSAAPSVTFNPEPGFVSDEGITNAYVFIEASEAVVWSYTKSAAVQASRASGTSGTTISFSIDEGLNGASRSGTASLQAHLGGALVGSWNISLNATGSGGGGGGAV